LPDNIKICGIVSSKEKKLLVQLPNVRPHYDG
jgi:hypothetical protein